MDTPGHLDINDFTYELPPERIAQYPLADRAGSKLLVYNKGRLSHDHFNRIAQYLPSNSLMIFNETRVIHARLVFKKKTGASIEIFCIEPVEPSRELEQAFMARETSTWKCLVGNSKKWKEGTLSMVIDQSGSSFTLEASRVEQHPGYSLVRFTWLPTSLNFALLMEAAGSLPLPPYIHREAEEADKERYQTVYAVNDGSVAAPTAGLHFNDHILERLQANDIAFARVTLHVGAGTFKPVTTSRLDEHQMHTEQVIIPRDTINTILDHTGRPVILVGTTTTRTIESLYWQGVRWLESEPEKPVLDIRQWDPYELARAKKITVPQALEKVLKVLDDYGQDALRGKTQLIIAPGYSYAVPDMILTNFHQPQSTLLLLVAAFIGEDWRKAYRYALDHEFRFLSYGDSCLFIR